MAIAKYSGHSAALSAFGLNKEAGFLTNPRLMGSLAGAGLGWMMAPEGQGLQGAALGGIGGYAAGAGVSRAGNAVGDAAGGIKSRLQNFQASRAAAKDPTNQINQAAMNFAQTEAHTQPVHKRTAQRGTRRRART
jgi:hypothetical protein